MHLYTKPSCYTIQCMYLCTLTDFLSSVSQFIEAMNRCIMKDNNTEVMLDPGNHQ